MIIYAPSAGMIRELCLEGAILAGDILCLIDTTPVDLEISELDLLIAVAEKQARYLTEDWNAEERAVREARVSAFDDEVAVRERHYSELSDMATVGQITADRVPESAAIIAAVLSEREVYKYQSRAWGEMLVQRSSAVEASTYQLEGRRRGLISSLSTYKVVADRPGIITWLSMPNCYVSVGDSLIQIEDSQ